MNHLQESLEQLRRQVGYMHRTENREAAQYVQALALASIAESLASIERHLAKADWEREIERKREELAS